MDIYLDNAATSHPKPDEVLAAVEDALTLCNANPGRSGHKRALDAARILLSCREAIMQYFGTDDPFDFVYCFNCTDALNLGIKGSLYKGDHVISTLLEHNSVLRVLKMLEKRGSIELTLLSPNSYGLIERSKVNAAIKRNTKLIALTHASNVTGDLQPAEEIGALAQKKGIYFLIDGAQAAGHLPIDLKSLHCDLYAFPGHKGLLGPQGTGGLYIAPDVVLNTIREGGTGSSSDNMFQPEERPERYESGTVNMHGIAGLYKGVLFVQEHLSDIYAHERMLTSHMLEGLRAIRGVTIYGHHDPSRSIGTVSFNVADFSSSVVADQLDGAGIAVRGGLHCAPGAHQCLGTLRQGAVRASVGHANTIGDIEILLRNVDEIARA